MKIFTTKDAKTTKEEMRATERISLLLGVLRVLGGKYFLMSVA